MMRAETRQQRRRKGVIVPLIPEQEFKGGPRNNASNYLLPPWSVAQRIYILFVQAPVASYTITITTTIITTIHPPTLYPPSSDLDWILPINKQLPLTLNALIAAESLTTAQWSSNILGSFVPANYHRSIHTFRPIVRFVIRSEHGIAVLWDAWPVSRYHGVLA